DDDEAVLPPVHHPGIAIVGARQGLAEDAARGLVRRDDVGVTPRRPQKVHAGRVAKIRGKSRGQVSAPRRSLQEEKFSSAGLTLFGSGCYSRRVFGTRVLPRKIRPLGSKPRFAAFSSPVPLHSESCGLASSQARRPAARRPSERQTSLTPVRVRG